MAMSVFYLLLIVALVVFLVGLMFVRNNRLTARNKVLEEEMRLVSEYSQKQSLLPPMRPVTPPHPPPPAASDDEEEETPSVRRLPVVVQKPRRKNTYVRVRTPPVDDVDDDDVDDDFEAPPVDDEAEAPPMDDDDAEANETETNVVVDLPVADNEQPSTNGEEEAPPMVESDNEVVETPKPRSRSTRRR
jgi:hypothetical protein